MSNLISWVEQGRRIYTLTGEEINSKKGQELLISLDEDFSILGNRAIVKYHGLGGNYESKENNHFWDGNLPWKVKNLWNKGGYDKLLPYLHSHDIELVINHEVSNEDSSRLKFAEYIFQEKYKNGFGDITEIDSEIIRLSAYLLEEDTKGMKKDMCHFINFVSVNGLDVSKLKNSGFNHLEFLYVILTTPFGSIKRPKIK
jgi:hypothetical protein